MIILHTRPHHDDDKMKVRVESAGFSFIHQPLFNYVSLSVPTIPPDVPLLVTSKAAIPVIPVNFKNRIYCVGQETASALKLAGFQDIIFPKHGIGVTSLLPLIRQDYPKQLSYLRGTTVKHNIISILAPDIIVNEYICYDTVGVTPYIIPRNTAAITFFSTQSYALFIKNCPNLDMCQSLIALCYCDNFTKSHQILWKSVITGSTIQHLIDTFGIEFLKK